jgi:hypothetical protein
MDEPLLHLNMGAMMRESSSERSFPNLNQRFEGLKASIWVPKVRFKFGKRLISNGVNFAKTKFTFYQSKYIFLKMEI